MSSDALTDTKTPLGDFVSDQLIRRADEITHAWLADAGKHGTRKAADDGPTTRLRKQVPEVVRGLAEFLRSPSEGGRDAVIGRLRLHADWHREQGSDVQQLLTDFEILSKLVFAAFCDAIESYREDANPIEVAHLAARLRESLMEITSEAVGLYRTRELEQRAELARRLSAFATTITHELKNPLGSAQAGAQMLREKEVAASADQQERFIKLVLRNLLRLHDLIDEIQGMALAPDSDGPERHALLADVVAKVFAELHEEANAKRVTLEIAGTIPEACVDAFRAEIVLVNLINNAIKYSDPRKDTRWVRVAVERSKERNGVVAWMVTIHDNGLGIPKALQGAVFRRHFRARPELAEGTGLGLAITEQVMTAAGGQIWFESEEGVGTAFHAIFPDRQKTPAAPLERDA